MFKDAKGKIININDKALYDNMVYNVESQGHGTVNLRAEKSGILITVGMKEVSFFNALPRPSSAKRIDNKELEEKVPNLKFKKNTVVIVKEEVKDIE